MAGSWQALVAGCQRGFVVVSSRWWRFSIQRFREHWWMGRVLSIKTRANGDLAGRRSKGRLQEGLNKILNPQRFNERQNLGFYFDFALQAFGRSEEHTSELQS